MSKTGIIHKYSLPFYFYWSYDKKNIHIWSK